MSDWWQQIGPLAGPLGACSLLTLMLILERLLFFASLGRTLVKRLRPLLTAARNGYWLAAIEQCQGQRGLPAQGLQLLATHRARPRVQREDILSLWLGEQHRKLHAHLKWLVLLAVVSPLLGLLGTVLGMIQAFGALAAHVGPVHPAVSRHGFATGHAHHRRGPDHCRARADRQSWVSHLGGRLSGVAGGFAEPGATGAGRGERCANLPRH
jgi:biopolymer transport protein ExbB